MDSVVSFAPIATAKARVLILGSMPGKASLAAQQYYAHAQNSFWRILGELCGFDPLLPYRMRVQHLQQQRIALWDVLKSCERPGSLDADIATHTEVPNDFNTFFQTCSNIQAVFFNGAKAEQVFNKHVVKTLTHETLVFTRLPSTSPAHAAMSYTKKLQAWQQIQKRGVQF